MPRRFFEVRNGAVCAIFEYHAPALQIVFHPDNADKEYKGFAFPLEGDVSECPLTWKGHTGSEGHDVIREVPYSEVEALIDAGKVDYRWREE